MSDQMLRVEIAERQHAADDIIVLDLVPVDGGTLPPFDPGAHVDVEIGPDLVRQYSLCGDPARSDRYRLGILLDPASRGGSSLFMDGAWASLVRADTAALDSYEAIVGRVEAAMADAQRDTDDPKRQFELFVKGFSNIYATEVPALRQFFSQHAIAPAARLDALAARKRRLEGVVLDLLQRGRDAGQFDLPNPTVASQAIFGMFGSVHRWPTDIPWEPESVAGTLQSLASALAGTGAPSTSG